MTHLIALAGRSAGLAGVRAGRGMGHQVRVGRTLRALAGAGVYVMAGGAGHAPRAGGLAAERTSPATGGQAVHGIADPDGVDPSHVAEPLTELRGRKQRKTKKGLDYTQQTPYLTYNSLCLRLTDGWFFGKPMCMKRKRSLP